MHSHFQQPDHNGFEDFSFKLIDSARNEADLRQRESFWQYKLATFRPDGLNLWDVPYQIEVCEQERYQHDDLINRITKLIKFTFNGGDAKYINISERGYAS